MNEQIIKEFQQLSTTTVRWISNGYYMFAWPYDKIQADIPINEKTSIKISLTPCMDLIEQTIEIDIDVLKQTFSRCIIQSKFDDNMKEKILNSFKWETVDLLHFISFLLQIEIYVQIKEYSSDYYVIKHPTPSGSIIIKTDINGTLVTSWSIQTNVNHIKNMMNLLINSGLVNLYTDSGTSMLKRRQYVYLKAVLKNCSDFKDISLLEAIYKACLWKSSVNLNYELTNLKNYFEEFNSKDNWILEFLKTLSISQTIYRFSSLRNTIKFYSDTTYNYRESNSSCVRILDLNYSIKFKEEIMEGGYYAHELESIVDINSYKPLSTKSLNLMELVSTLCVKYNKDYFYVKEKIEHHFDNINLDQISYALLPLIIVSDLLHIPIKVLKHNGNQYTQLMLINGSRLTPGTVKIVNLQLLPGYKFMILEISYNKPQSFIQVDMQSMLTTPRVYTPPLLSKNSIDKLLKPGGSARVSCPDMQVIESRYTPVVCDIVYEGSNNGEYTINVIPDQFTPKSISYSSIRIPFEDFQVFRHDYTFGSLVSSTDISFKDMNLSIGDDDDYKTPDYMTWKNNHLMVVEFTTRRSDYDTTIASAWRSKKLKYESMITNRCVAFNKKATYYIIVVTPTSVITNLKLPQHIAQELIYRYRLSGVIINTVAEKEKIELLDEEQTKQEVKLTHIINSIQMENINEEKISKKCLNNMCAEVNEIDEQNANELLISGINKATKQIHTDILHFLSYDKNPLVSIKKCRVENYYTDEKSYLNSLDKENTRNDLKSVVNVPLFDPDVDVNGSVGLDHLINELNLDILCTDPTLKIWLSASQNRVKYNGSNIDIVSETERLAKTLEEQKQIDKEQKPLRRYYNRFKFNISESDKIELAKVGVKGKKHNNNLAVKFYKNEKKKSFNILTTNTDDIELFLQKECISDNLVEDSIMDNRSKDIVQLLESAAQIHNSVDSQPMIKFVKNYHRSFIGKYLRFISDLATELSLSLQQHCTGNQVIIKKLRYFNVYVLISPTCMSGKLFYSLLWFDRKAPLSNGRVFRECKSLSNIKYTDMVSVNVSKLTNMIRAEAMGLALLSFWSEFYSLSDWFMKTVQGISTENSDILSMTWFTLLVFLNDKHQAEELITMTRFIHMEALVVGPALSRPSKMFEKFPTVYRSRLEVFLYKRNSKLMKEYSYELARNDPENMRIWKGFKNPYLLNKDKSLSDIDNQDQMLNLCYLGYLKNKDEEPEANSSGGLLSKILGLEDQLPRYENGLIDRRYLGEENPKFDTIKKHEFNSSFLKTLCKRALLKIKNNRGEKDPKRYLAREIIKRWSKQTLNEFATLKASSNFSEEWYVYDINKKYHRSKVLEKIADLLSEVDENSTDVLVIDLLLKSLKELEIHKGLHICIFKKNQHGGLREIYVLDLYGRIVQKCLEDASRVILNEFPSETMTHPKNKFSIPENHNKDAKARYGGSYHTYATSDDAAKWNQGHYVTKFSMMLCNLLPESFHPFIIRSIQLWLVKRIKITDDLLKIFEETSDFITSDPVVQKIHDIYKGKETADWMSKGNAYITTESGMMQGILHYTSSLFHTLYLDFLSDIAREHLDRIYKNNGLDVHVLVNNMQSSDDSSMLISIPIQDGRLDHEVLLGILMIFTLKDILGQQLGIYKSVKSTTLTLFAMEFNSEFSFFGDIHRPTFRWVNASILVSEQETLIARQEESYNLITNIVQGGGTFSLAHICHLGQSLLHYRLLGSSCSELWPLYAWKVQTLKDPAFGFFLVDHPLATGLAGLNYLLWLTCRKTDLGKKYKLMFTDELKTENKFLKNVTIETSSIGLFSRSTSIMFGTNERWKKLMDKFKEKDLILDDIDSNPRMLFFKPSNVKEVNARLLVKLLSPGVVSSLGKSNALPRILCSSVYILSRPILSTSTAFYTNIHGAEKSTKITLISDVITSDCIINNNTTLTSKNPSSGDIINADVHIAVPYITNKVDTIITTLYQNIFLKDIDLNLYKNGFMAYLLSNDLVDKDETYSNLESQPLEKILKLLSLYLNVNIFECGEEIRKERYKIIKSYETSSSQLNIFISLTSLCFIILQTHPDDSVPLTVDVTEKFSLSEERLLFPHLDDYLSLESSLSNLSLVRSRKIRNNRRRQRSSVIITGSEDIGAVKLERILIWKWFGVNMEQLSYTTLQSLFDDVQVMIPWIQSTIEETLKRSPFTTYIQLQNFISRQDKSSRSVHMIGSYGRSKYGIINISSIIRNNFSNGLIFEVDNIQSSFKVRDGSMYLHILTSLANLPMDKTYKTNLVYSLLTKGPEINIKRGNINSNIAKLGIIQQILNKDPDLWIGAVRHESLSQIVTSSVTTTVPTEHQIESEMIKTEKYFNDNGIDTIYERFEYYRDNYEGMMANILCEVEEGETITGAKEMIIDELVNNIETDWLQSLVGKVGLKKYRDGLIKSEKDLEQSRQAFSKYIPILINHLHDLRLGIYGFYTTSQKYDHALKRYIGKGIWEGTFEDINIKIFINGTDDFETEITNIIISNTKNWDTTLNHLKQWCKDNNVSNTCRLKNQVTDDTKVLCYLKNFKTLSKPVVNSPAVYVDSKLQINHVREYSNYSLEISTRSLRLLGHYSQPVAGIESRQVTLIYIPMSLNMFNLETTSASMQNFEFINGWHTWIRDWVMNTSTKETFELFAHILRDPEGSVERLDNMNYYYIEEETLYMIKQMLDHKLSTKKEQIKMIEMETIQVNIPVAPIYTTADLINKMAEIHALAIDSLSSRMNEIDDMISYSGIDVTDFLELIDVNLDGEIALGKLHLFHSLIKNWTDYIGENIIKCVIETKQPNGVAYCPQEVIDRKLENLIKFLLDIDELRPIRYASPKKPQRFQPKI